MNSKLFLLWAALAALLAGSLRAADPLAGSGISGSPTNGQTVLSLTVTGATSVSPDSVLAVVRQRKGEPLNDSVVNEDVKRIWKLGKFEDVRLDVAPGPGGNGVSLNYIVSEMPSIEDVRYFGNKEVGDGSLSDKSGIKVGDPLDQDKLAAAVRALQAVYKDKDFYAAQITVDTKPGAQPGKVVVNFRVAEGNKMKVEKIEVVGNKVFSADKVKGEMKDTSEAGWFMGGSYDPEKMFDDYESVLKAYAQEGYVKATLGGASLNEWGEKGRGVVQNSTTFDEANKRIELKLQIAEGSLYHMAGVTLTGNTIFSDAELRAKMDSLQSKDKVFNQELWDKDLQKLRQAYASKGYIYASVQPDYTWDDTAGLVSAKITVQESTKAYIEEIRIRGNEVTKEKVIRRMITLKPGDPFDSDAVNKNRMRIYNLGYFEQVTVDTQPGSEMDKLILIYDVSPERKTGTLSLGAGYSSVQGLVGFLQVSQNNLFGNGQSVSAQWNFGSSTNSYNLSFTEPWLFDKPVLLGADLFRTLQTTAYNNQGFNLLSTGGTLRTGYNFNETPYKIGTSYRYQTDDISDVSGSLIGITAGITHLSVITPSVTRDTRDNVFDPSTGTYNVLSVELAGGYLGGDDAFVKPVLDSRAFFATPVLFGQTWMRDFVLGLHGRVGWAVPYDDGMGSSQVPTSERFFMGGTDTVRGYDERSLGASDIGGGTYEFLTNVEYSYKPAPMIKLHVFYDAGNSWTSTSDYQGFVTGYAPGSVPGNGGQGGVNLSRSGSLSGAEWPNHLVDAQYYTQNNMYLYPSVGAGLLFTIPTSVIQIRLDWGYSLDPVARQAGDVEGGRVHFNIGNIF